MSAPGRLDSGLPAGGERFELQRLAARPWKNGGGVTREIAVSPEAAGLDTFDWRLSVAEVERDGPFSAFPGVDRQIMLLRGTGMRLRAADGSLDHRLDRPGACLAFRGELGPGAALFDGPTQDLNTMTRRGAWRAEMESHHEAARVDGADALMLLSCAGTWQVGAGAQATALGAGEGLLWRAPVAAIDVSPTAAQRSAWLVAVRLCHEPEA